MPNNNMLGPIKGAWPEDHCAELTRLLASGMIYREIANTLNEKFGANYSKNSVVGKVCRLGLVPPEKPKAAPYVRKRSPRPRIKREVLRIVSANSNSNAMRVVSNVVLQQERLRCVEIVPRNVSLLDLEPNDCRYPYGDGPMTFCGHPKQAGSQYCTPHHFLCWERPRVLVDRRFAGVAA